MSASACRSCRGNCASPRRAGSFPPQSRESPPPFLRARAPSGGARSRRGRHRATASDAQSAACPLPCRSRLSRRSPPDLQNSPRRRSRRRRGWGELAVAESAALGPVRAHPGSPLLPLEAPARGGAAPSLIWLHLAFPGVGHGGVGRAELGRARSARGQSDKWVGRRETMHLWVAVHWAGKMHTVYRCSVGE
jgi:hypothetical protein